MTEITPSHFQDDSNNGANSYNECFTLDKLVFRYNGL